MIESTSSTSTRRSVFLPAVLLIACGILLAVAMTEAVLRFAPGLLSVELQQIIEAEPDNLGVSHPFIGYLHKPNNALIITGRDFRAVAHTDGYGFRNSWPWPEKAEVVTLGDSVAFGYGVEDDQAWPAIMAKGLSHNRLINLALIGAGPQQYLRVYETFGTKLNPKLLLVGFLVRNDFWDADIFDRWLKSGAGGNYMVWRDFGRPKSTTLSLEQPVRNLLSSLLWRGHLLASESRLYNLLIYVRKYLKGAAAPNTKIFQAPGGTRLELELRDFAIKTVGAQPGTREFEISVDALERLQSVANANGIKVLVVLQPSKEEVYLPLMGDTTRDADPGRPLREMLQRLDIPYIDLLPDFRSRAAKGEVLFFETDGHPNPGGHALIANLVLNYVKNNAKAFNLTDPAESFLR
jgi:lysophospholipase L1-like esterase